MKKFLVVCILFAFGLTSCKSEKANKEEVTEEMAVNYDSFGDKITDEDTLSSEEMMMKFENLQVGDTINVKFKSTIADVCTKKGCWMKLPLANEKEAMVKFKDYGFFMPLDSKGKEVIVEGKAFLTITPVDELKHYAEDAGKSAEEIVKITEPKKEMAFEANGALIKA
jgi:hypothetical protein